MGNRFESVVIREWKGFWAKGPGAPDFTAPAGGFVLTFHQGTNPPHKIEHYDTVEEILGKYPQYAWFSRDINDPPDIVLIGI